MKRHIIVLAALASIVLLAPPAQSESWFKKAREGIKGVGNVFNKNKDKCSSITSLVGGMTGYGDAAYEVNQGCLLGKDLMKILSEEDQAGLATSTQQAIATGEDGSFEGNGANANITVKKENTKTQKNKVPVLKDKVEEMPPLELVGAQYQAMSGINVRGGPGTDYKVVGKLAAADTVDVIGKVEDKTWFLIGQGGVATGFVFESLLEPTGQMGGGEAPPEGEIAEIQTSTEVTCRTVEQEVVLEDGTSHSESSRWCQKPDGSWELA